MGTVLFRKILRDLFTEKWRTIIVIVALFIGIFSVTMMSTAYTILKRELALNYKITLPAEATLFFSEKNDDQIEQIMNSGIVDAAETREKIVARIKTTDNSWTQIWLYVVDDFNDLKINKFKLEKGQFPVKENDILIERAVKQLFGSELNSSYELKLPGGPEKTFAVTGVAHDPGLSPAWMEGIAYGYITKSGVKYLGIEHPSSELNIIFRKQCSAEQPHNLIETIIALHNKGIVKKNDSETTPESLTKLMEFLHDKNVNVQRTEIHDTTRHPHESQLDSLLYMIFAFGILTLFLSTILVINMISAIMSKQIRQIGVLKAIGSNLKTIIVFYSLMIFIMGVVATLAGIPIGIKAGIAYSYLTSKMLNFTLFSESLSFQTLHFQILFSLALPVLVSIFPIIYKGKSTALELLNSYGVETRFAIKKTIFNTITSKIIPNPVYRMSLKNTFRKKGRVILTILTLSLGGAIFISAFNIKSSTNYMIKKAFNKINADIIVSLNSSFPDSLITQSLQTESTISHFEPYRNQTGFINLDNGSISPPVSIVSYNANTSIVSFDVEEGNWLQSDKKNSVVINSALSGKYKAFKPGSTIKIQCGEHVKTYSICGIVRQPFTLPTIYITLDAASEMADDNKSENIGICLKSTNLIDNNKSVMSIEQRLSSAGLTIKNIVLKSVYKEKIVEHLKLITFMLIMITLLIIIVGGLAQTASMNINILERKKRDRYFTCTRNVKCISL